MRVNLNNMITKIEKNDGDFKNKWVLVSNGQQTYDEYLANLNEFITSKNLDEAFLFTNEDKELIGAGIAPYQSLGLTTLDLFNWVIDKLVIWVRTEDIISK